MADSYTDQVTQNPNWNPSLQGQVPYGYRLSEPNMMGFQEQIPVWYESALGAGNPELYASIAALALGAGYASGALGGTTPAATGTGAQAIAAGELAAPATPMALETAAPLIPIEHTAAIPSLATSGTTNYLASAAGGATGNVVGNAAAAAAPADASSLVASLALGTSAVASAYSTKTAADAAKESADLQKQTADAALAWQMEQDKYNRAQTEAHQARWTKLYGSMEENIAAYANSLNPTQATAQKLQTIQAESQRARKALEQQAAQTGMSTTAQAAIQSQMDVMTAQQKAQARYDTPKEVMAEKSKFLTLGTNINAATSPAMMSGGTGAALTNLTNLYGQQASAAATQEAAGWNSLANLAMTGADMYARGMFGNSQAAVNPAPSAAAIGTNLPVSLSNNNTLASMNKYSLSGNTSLGYSGKL